MQVLARNNRNKLNYFLIILEKIKDRQEAQFLMLLAQETKRSRNPKVKKTKRSIKAVINS